MKYDPLIHHNHEENTMNTQTNTDRQFNKIVKGHMKAERDEMFAQAKAERGKIDPLAAAVWGTVIVTGLASAYFIAWATYTVITATWGDVSGWFS